MGAMNWTVVLAGLFLLNSICVTYGPGTAMVGVDPIILGLAAYGVSHLEMLMLKVSAHILVKAHRMWTS